MAKRKAPRAKRRTLSAKRVRPRRPAARGRKKHAPRKRTARKAGAAARLRKRSTVRARKAPARKAKTARKVEKVSQARRRASAPKKARARKQSAKPAASRRTPPQLPVIARKAPALNRERRTINDDDLVPTPPSSLDLDRSASAARTGRRELHERFAQHTETSPALTGGDIDADWESAYSVGDEAPGGDNPTPDQDIVDDIGRAVGVQYEDNEELKGEKKIKDRDRKRWELDPASSEDYNDR